MKTSTMILGGVAAYLGIGAIVAYRKLHAAGCPNPLSFKPVQVSTPGPGGLTNVVTCPPVQGYATVAVAWPLFTFFSYHK